jgi:hypothetical protein
MASSNTYFDIPKEGHVMSNGTFNNVKYVHLSCSVM